MKCIILKIKKKNRPKLSLFCSCNAAVVEPHPPVMGGDARLFLSLIFPPQERKVRGGGYPQPTLWL
jgi:hypothetical protein